MRRRVPRAGSAVRVMGRDYRITAEDDDENSGYCDKHAARINVDPRQDRFSIRDALLHEFMHAILHQQGFDHPYELEESFVRPLASGLITLFADNPRLASELFAAPRKPKENLNGPRKPNTRAAPATR